MKLIKTTIILAFGAFLLPSPPQGDILLTGLSGNGGRPAGSAELALAAMRAASDIGGFCDRQPMVCETAGHAWRSMQVRVKYSVRLLYEWANEGHGAPAQDARGEEVSYPPLPVLPVLPAQPGPGGIKAGARPAKDNARIPARQAKADGLITGAITRAASRKTTGDENGSENTLRIEDLLTPWNGPAAG